jgi:hypothetical protein
VVSHHERAALELEVTWDGVGSVSRGCVCRTRRVVVRNERRRSLEVEKSKGKK